MEGDDTDLSTLLSLENNSFLKEKRELVDDENYSAGYDEDYLKMLFDREKNGEEPLVLSNYLKEARKDAISWIMIEEARLKAISWILKARATFGFRFQTAYLSMLYFDRFLSRRPVIDIEKRWVNQLLSIASLSLAAKMEEIKVPALSEYQTEYSFENKTIERMEFLVLNTLEWRMDSITPFLFLRFFIKKFYTKSPPPDHTMSTIIQVIFSSMKEISVFQHRPSVIAMASIFRALSIRLEKKMFVCKMHNISFSWEFPEIEDVFTCSELMQKLEMPKSINSSDMRATEALDDDPSSSGVEQK